MMKKISLIAVNSRYTHTNPAVRYLKKYCTDRNTIIDILEYSIKSDIEEVIKKIIKSEYDAAAFSVYIWNIKFIKKVINRLAEKGFSGKIIMGGPEVSYNAGEILSQLPAVDYVVTGFGEEAFRTLIESNFEYPHSVVSVQNPPFDKIPFIYGGDNLVEYNDRYVYYETSRGCPYRCSYCLSSAGGHEPDLRYIEMVKTEIIEIINSGRFTVKFIDRTFNYHRDRSIEIWQHIIKHTPRGMKYHFEINPALLDENSFEVLAGAPDGIFRIEAGIQSLNRDALKAVSRPDNPETVLENIERLAALNNIHLHVDLIAGLPYEDIDSFRKGFNRLFAVKPDHIQAGYLKLLPGTRLRGEAEKYGIRYEAEPPYEVLSTYNMSSDDITLIKRVARIVDLYYNSEKYPLTLSNIIADADDPFCFFEDISNYAILSNRETTGEDPVYLLAAYIRDNLSVNRDFLYDCIRWDRAASGIRGGEPPFIRNRENYNIKRKLWKVLTVKKRGRIEREKFKRGIVFIPQSGLFKKNYMGDHEAALFNEKGEPPFLFNLD